LYVIQIPSNPPAAHDSIVALPLSRQYNLLLRMKKDTNIISVKNLTKKFKEIIAVNHISFEVDKGEIFAFLGPNGAGKSTTIKMLTTLLEPTAGEIIVNGFNPKNDKDSVRHSFGIVFQDPSLDDDLTAQENMQFHAVLYKIPKEVREKRIQELLQFVELWERRNDLVKTFSGGMKRRLEIARGLLHHPKILFLDEPTLGLDPQTRKHTWDYIKNINQKENMTVFFTTHYMEEAEKVAQRIAIIDHGKIVAQGTNQELQNLTKTNSLEEVFLSLTGHEIRNEELSAIDRMRQRRMMRHH
jgi:ABC-2 type transport system ATP-binding protein